MLMQEDITTKLNSQLITILNPIALDLYSSGKISETITQLRHPNDIEYDVITRQAPTTARVDEFSNPAASTKDQLALIHNIPNSNNIRLPILSTKYKATTVPNTLTDPRIMMNVSVLFAESSTSDEYALGR